MTSPSPVALVCRAFGGRRPAARVIGCSDSLLRQWERLGANRPGHPKRAPGHVPHEWNARILAAGKVHGVPRAWLLSLLDKPNGKVR